MASKEISFKSALEQAQERGYAEKNPALDINGFDTAHKLLILSYLASGKYVPLENIRVEGIHDITLNDIRYASDWGYVIKLLGIFKVDGERIELRVHPTLLPKGHILAGVVGVYNAIFIKADPAGDLLFYGEGAGGDAASSAVVNDILEAALAYKIKHSCKDFSFVASHQEKKQKTKIKRIDELESRYYVRFQVLDKPGVLAKISDILGKHKISIASVLQKGRRRGKIVPIVMMTHDAKESALRSALAEIDKLYVIQKKTQAIRIER